MNLASRLEAVCGPMEILVDETTHDMIHTEFAMDDIGVHEIRGFGSQPVWRLERAMSAANDSVMF